MSFGIGKTSNEYADAVCDIDASKTVWMAIAYSFARRLTANDTHDEARALLLSEWGTLHVNGIVPQKPKVHAV